MLKCVKKLNMFSESEQIAKLANKFNLDLIILFGSQARGTTHAQSDTDIAVRANHKLSIDERIDIALAFDQFYKDVEIADIKSASPLLLAAITKDSKLLFEAQPDLFHDFKLYALNSYFDFKPVLDRQNAIVKKKIMEL